MSTPYTAHLRVGAHTWDVDSTDPADYGPTAGLRFAWTAPQDQGWPTQHDPSILTFAVIVEQGSDFAQVDQGTTVHYTFTPTGYAAPLVTFGGTVRDVTGRPHQLGMLYELTAVDHLLALKSDYQTIYTILNGAASSTRWGLLVSGTQPPLPDPMFGQDLPGNFGGAQFGDELREGSPWDLMVSFLGRYPLRVGATPLAQRALLTYQLDGTGELLASRPYIGRWHQHGPRNAPQELEPGPDGVRVGGGQIDGCLLPTDSAMWARLRDEPNTVVLSSGAIVERAHTGSDIVRVDDLGGDASFGSSEAYWVVSGVDAPDQWSTELVLRASSDPASVAGWFDLPSAMRTFVACRDIAPRHTPSGAAWYAGMLAGAALTVLAGGEWDVAFTLRRTLPDTMNGAATSSTDALEWDELDAALEWDQLDPAVAWRDLMSVGSP